MNPYKQWLAIATQSPPDHFKLLGISRDEQDLDTIKTAAKLQLRKIKKHQSGEHQAIAEQLSVRIKKAHRVVSNPALRQDYLELLLENEREIRDLVEDNAIVVPIGKPEDSSQNSTVLLGLMIALGLGCCLLSALTLSACWMAGLFDGSNPQPRPNIQTRNSVAQAEANPVLKTESADSKDEAQALASQETNSNTGPEKENAAATETAVSSPTETPTLAIGEQDHVEHLEKLRVERGVPVNPIIQMTRAQALTTSGNHYKAAELYASVNRGHIRSAASLRMEAAAWEKANQKPKAISVLKESIEAYRFVDGRIYNKIAVADAFVRCGDPDSAIKIYTDLMKSPEAKSRIRDLERKLAKAIALSKTADPVALGVEELVDPLRDFRIAAEKLENRKEKNPILRITNLLRAAKSRRQAKEPEKAVAAIDEASQLLRDGKVREDRIEGFHRDIGEALYELNENEKSFEHFSILIHLADTEYEIKNHQKFIQGLLRGKNPLEKTEEVKHLLTPEFMYRSLASHIELAASASSSGQASNFIRATEYWVKVKDVEEVKRCGLLAENAIKSLSNRHGNKLYSHRALGNLYMEIKLDEQAVQQYVLAMDWADQDDDAVKLYDKVKGLCQRSNLPLPTLKPSTDAKLDPLNRFRVAATKLEIETRRTSELAPTKLLVALENWLKAGEKAKASETADKIATALLNNKKRSSYATNCAKLAAYFLHLEDETSARRFYQLAIEDETNDAKRAKLQSSLDALNK